MSLDRLANEITSLSFAKSRTAVLVAPPTFSLRAPFFLELVRSLRSIDPRQIQPGWNPQDGRIIIDFCRTRVGLFDLLRIPAYRSLARVTRQMLGKSDVGHDVQVRTPGLVSRPHSNDAVVVAYCDTAQELPAWATPIRLGSEVS